mmetsp:Transcript_12347/g.18471  ORF Transcript_12347/g.18471 Transcript_12347/m.18471 type:complete len:80 (+) Transcript_12347:439-678(+)
MPPILLVSILLKAESFVRTSKNTPDEKKMFETVSINIVIKKRLALLLFEEFRCFIVIVVKTMHKLQDCTTQQTLLNIEH